MQNTKERIEVMQAYLDGRKISATRADGTLIGVYRVNQNGDLSWMPDLHYAVVPNRPDAINWSHVSSKYNYLARDYDGRSWLYEEKPQRLSSSFDGGSGDCIRAHGFASYVNHGSDWTESLSSRIISETAKVTFRVDGMEIRD